MIWLRWALCGLVCGAAQLLLLPELVPRFLRPDLLVLFILWTAIRMGPVAGMSAATAFGVFYDATILSPLVGVSALGLLAVAFLPVALEVRVLTGNHAAIAAMTALGVLAADAVRYLVYQGAGYIPLSMPFLVSSSLWDRALTTTLLAVVFTIWLDGCVGASAYSVRQRAIHTRASA